MKYLPVNERYTDEVSDYLGNYVSKSIKSGFALDVLEKYGQGGNLLDVGCASGAFAKEASALGYKVYGVDLEDYRQKENKKLYSGFKTADLNKDKIPYSADYFNTIMALCVIPHLENPYHFIREVYRVLRKDGIFIFTLPHIESPSNKRYFYKTGNFISYSQHNDHVSILTPAIIEKVIKDKFEIIGREYFVKDKVFTGWKGKIIRLFHGYFNLGQRYGSKVAIVLRKINNS